MQPARRLHGEMRVLPDRIGRWIGAGVEAGTEKNDVTVHPYATLLLSLLHVLDRNVAEIWNVAHVEADRLPHEQVERHLVHRLPLRIDVLEGIDVRADMIEHRDEVCLERHRVAGHAEIEHLRRFMVEVRGDDRPLKKLMRRHVVFNEKTEIDDTLRHVFPHSCGDRRSSEVSGLAQRRSDVASAALVPRYLIDGSAVRVPPGLRTSQGVGVYI